MEEALFIALLGIGVVSMIVSYLCALSQRYKLRHVEEALLEYQLSQQRLKMALHQEGMMRALESRLEHDKGKLQIKLGKLRYQIESIENQRVQGEERNGEAKTRFKVG